MLRSFARLVLAAALVLIVAAASLAQQPGGSGQWSQMREKYKYTFQLMQMTRQIGEINKNPKYALSQDQAKKVLAVLQPLRAKPKLTQDQAKATLKSLKPIFRVDQLNAMARVKQPQRRPGQGMGGSRPGGSGGPGGPGGGQGARRNFDPNAMKDFNPFYSKVKAGDEFSKRRVARTNEFFSTLDAKAKGKKLPAKPAPAKKPAAKKPAPKK